VRRVGEAGVRAAQQIVFTGLRALKQALRTGSRGICDGASWNSFSIQSCMRFEKLSGTVKPASRASIRKPAT
jgi:hypothetical protein